MKKKLLSIALLFTFIHLVYAFKSETLYTAHLTGQDRYDIHGKRLRSVRTILRQDRYNVHIRKKGTSHDDIDDYFAKPLNRSLFNRAKIKVSDALAKRIMSNETIAVCVIIFPKEIYVESGLCPNQ